MLLAPALVFGLLASSPAALLPGAASEASAPEVAAPGAAAPGASARSVELDIPEGSYFAGPEGRKTLKYLVSCALDEGTPTHLTVGGERTTFPGGTGLAPAWAERPLTLAEQRWVSACLYSRVNKLGLTVLISQRAAHQRLGPEPGSAAEERDYRLHEGGFFGNVFLPEPVAYVCEGKDRARMLGFPVGRVRRCAQPSGRTTPEGRPISECDFVIAGRCHGASGEVVDGARYREVVHVWLPRVPRGPGRAVRGAAR